MCDFPSGSVLIGRTGTEGVHNCYDCPAGRAMDNPRVKPRAGLFDDVELCSRCPPTGECW